MTRGPVWGAAREDLNATKPVWPAGAARAACASRGRSVRDDNLMVFLTPGSISDADALARDPVDPLHAVRTGS